MLITVTTEIKFIECEDIFGVIVGDISKCAEFTLGGFFVCKKISNLKISFLP